MAYSEDKVGIGSFITTFLFGAAAGAVVALLTAPKSGRDTRQWLKERAEDLGENMQRLPAKFQKAGSRALEAGREAYGAAREEYSASTYGKNFSKS